MIISFDLYGTIVDWRSSIGGVLRVIGVDEQQFFRTEYEELRSTETFRPYSEILRTTLMRVMQSDYSVEHGNALVLSFAKSQPFPDAIIALPRLKAAGHRLALISNTERRLIGITLCGMDHLFDWIVTAEDTGVYKPSPEAFVRAYSRMGISGKQDVVHVSAYPSYDLIPASQLGLKTVLVNRYADAWPIQVPSLLELGNALRGH